MSAIYQVTDEQQAMAETVRRFLAERTPHPAVGDTEHGVPDTATWRILATEIGLGGIAIPEEYGGLGLGPVDLGLVTRETGRFLLNVPFLSSTLAAVAVLAVGSANAKAAELPALASGARSAALVLPSGTDSPVSASDGEGDGATLDGVATGVLSGLCADTLVVLVRRGSGLRAYAADGAEVDRSPVRVLDVTRSMARLSFSSTPARFLGEVEVADGVLDHIVDTALVCLSGEVLGGAQALLEACVEYAKSRVQFGRPIGSFQAIKHKLANMLLSYEMAASVWYAALWALEGSGLDRSSTASMAKAVCGDMYYAIAAESIQVHGGIGFTWELDLHLHYKRAVATQVLFGTSNDHRRRCLTA